MDCFSIFGNGIWIKGNLHCHSTVSDGAYHPKELSDIYQEMGYGFLAISDHNLLETHHELSSEGFTLLSAVEIKLYPQWASDGCADWKTYHLGILPNPSLEGAAWKSVQIPIRTAQTQNTVLELQAWIDDLNRQGHLVMLNHPLWSRLAPEDFLDLRGLWGMEIYNSQCAVDGDDCGQGTAFWDLCNLSKARLYGIAADDNHNVDNILSVDPQKITANSPRWPSGRGWVTVRAKDFSAQAIWEALRAGSFYASTGPELYDIRLEGNCVSVECSPVQKIQMISYPRRGYGVFTTSDALKSAASFQLKGDETFFRIECIDAQGKTAWSNPVYLPV